MKVLADMAGILFHGSDDLLCARVSNFHLLSTTAGIRYCLIDFLLDSGGGEPEAGVEDDSLDELSSATDSLSSSASKA